MIQHHIVAGVATKANLLAIAQLQGAGLLDNLRSGHQQIRQAQRFPYMNHIPRCQGVFANRCAAPVEAILAAQVNDFVVIP